MRLVKIKLLTDFRSLKRGFEMNFYTQDVPDQLISPTCIVGKNGSGKSNLLELICEIFFYLDSMLLDFPSQNILSKKKFGFEIEYLKDITLFDPIREWLSPELQWDTSFVHVKIVKKANEKPEYNLVDKKGILFNLFQADSTIRELRDKQKQILPSHVIGYSSGLNELISNPFVKMQFHYFHEYQARLTADILDSFDDGRMLYMNHESNAAIILANYLLQDDNIIEVLNLELDIFSLDSFRITLEFGNSIEVDSDSSDDKGFADVTDFFKDEINFLERASTTQNKVVIQESQTSQTRTVTILDFKVTNSTKAAFRHFFGSAENLYKFLHKINLINIYKIPDINREKIRNSGRGQNITNLLPKLAADDLLFKIDNIVFKKAETLDKIFYSRFSDGEHQFMHIMGTFMILNESANLFVLDEPETHLNPKWRSKLVSTLNKIQFAKVESVSNQTKKTSEIILSTHSPFILSDSSNIKVWKFKNYNKQPFAEAVKFRTYGASFSVLLDEILEKEDSVSEMSAEYINSIRLQAQSLDLNDELSSKIIETLKEDVIRLGESPEKFELYSFLNGLIRIKNQSKK